MATILKLKNITKKFGETLANDHVNLSLEEGEILAILGENGCGKTSLMNVIAGIYHPDEGEIFIRGEKAHIESPKDAFSYRIGMVHQHFKLVDVLTARENIVLGLSKEHYNTFYNEQLEKVTEKESVLGSVKDLKEKLAQLKAKLKDNDLTPEERDNVTKDITKTKRDLKKIKDYRRYARRAKRFSPSGAEERINNLAAKYGFKIDPNKKIYNMSVSEKQTVEIMKVLYRGVDILILDEPTAVLTPQEIDMLFDAVRNLKKAGKSVIIITHKLNEVMAISDKVAVLRKGQHIGTVETSKTNENELTEMMVGRKVKLNIERKLPVNPVDRLFIKNLTYKNKEGVYKLKGINLTARSGEILGIAGVAGSGQKELLECVAGVAKLNDGEVIFHNPKKDVPLTLFHHTVKQAKALAAEGHFYNPNTKETVSLEKMNNKSIAEEINNNLVVWKHDEIINLKDRNPQQIRELGIRLSFVPEDRLGMGLVGDMSITDNMLLRSYRKGSGIFVHKKQPETLAEEIVHDLEVVTPNLETPVRKLSGGNIQKVLVGREISYAPKVLMAAYPVRGLDINSSFAIYNLLNKQKEKGTAVIFVGEDLDVLLALSDRIAVICDGKITGVVDARHVTKQEIGVLMTKHEDDKGGKENGK